MTKSQSLAAAAPLVLLLAILSLVAIVQVNAYDNPQLCGTGTNSEIRKKKIRPKCDAADRVFYVASGPTLKQETVPSTFSSTAAGGSKYNFYSHPTNVISCDHIVELGWVAAYAKSKPICTSGTAVDGPTLTLIRQILNDKQNTAYVDKTVELMKECIVYGLSPCDLQFGSATPPAESVVKPLGEAYLKAVKADTLAVVQALDVALKPSGSDGIESQWTTVSPLRRSRKHKFALRNSRGQPLTRGDVLDEVALLGSYGLAPSDLVSSPSSLHRRSDKKGKSGSSAGGDDKFKEFEARARKALSFLKNQRGKIDTFLSSTKTKFANFFKNGLAGLKDALGSVANKITGKGKSSLRRHL